MKQVLSRLFIVALFLVSLAVVVYTVSDNDTEKANKEYFEKCTFIYKTSSGLEIIKNNFKPDVYINNSKTSYFVVTYITYCYGVPSINNIKEIKPNDTLKISEKDNLLMNGVGRDAYWFSYSLLKQEKSGVMVPDSVRGVWFIDQDGKLCDYIVYENNEQKGEKDSWPFILSVVSSSIIFAMLILGLASFLREEKVWAGKDIYEGYVLRKSRITRRYILVIPDCFMSCCKIYDMNRDGIADYAERIAFAGRMVIKTEIELTAKYREAYSYALSQVNK